MRAFKRFNKRGFTLVELMIVVAIIGVLAALAIYGVRRYLASAKTSEAKNTIGAIARGAQQAYERENAPNQLLGDGASSATTMHVLCGTSSAVPAVAPKGTKYQPNTVEGQDFRSGDAYNGWKCLKFTLNQPVYYSYMYTNGGARWANLVQGASTEKFGIDAQGDLNGDGTFSWFGRSGEIRNGEVVLSTEIQIENEYE